MSKTGNILFSAIALLGLVIFSAVPGLAQERATPQEVYELILEAVPVIEELGEEGLEAFKDPNGEFVYKDTYVLVLDCDNLVLAAHPNEKIVGIDLSNHLDKNPEPDKRKNHDKALCKVGSRPNGGWVEYY